MPRENGKGFFSKLKAKLWKQDTGTQHKPALSEKEMQMINMLNSIDFSNSHLPEEVKNRKTIREGQKYCDLELAARWMANHLQEHPQTIDADIRGLDIRILALIGYFDGAVKDGNAMTAEYSKTCLMKAVDIRSRVSTQKPESVKHFVEVNEDYLDTWMTVLETAKKIDEEEKENKKLDNRCLEAREHAENLENLIMCVIDDETFPSRDLCLKVYTDVLTSEGKEAEAMRRMEAWDDLQWRFFFLICFWTDSVLLHRLDTSLHEEMTLQAEERVNQLQKIYTALLRMPSVDENAAGAKTSETSPVPSLQQEKQEEDSGKREKAQCILEELQSKYGLLSQVPIENIEMRKEALNKMEELKKKILLLDELLEKQEIPPKDLPNHQAVLGIVREFLEGWEKELMLSQLFNQPEEDNEEVLRSMSGPELMSFLGLPDLDTLRNRYVKNKLDG